MESPNKTQQNKIKPNNNFEENDTSSATKTNSFIGVKYPKYSKMQSLTPMNYT